MKLHVRKFQSILTRADNCEKAEFSNLASGMILFILKVKLQKTKLYSSTFQKKLYSTISTLFSGGIYLELSIVLCLVCVFIVLNVVNIISIRRNKNAVNINNSNNNNNIINDNINNNANNNTTNHNNSNGNDNNNNNSSSNNNNNINNNNNNNSQDEVSINIKSESLADIININLINSASNKIIKTSANTKEGSNNDNGHNNDVQVINDDVISCHTRLGDSPICTNDNNNDINNKTNIAKNTNVYKRINRIKYLESIKETDDINDNNNDDNNNDDNNNDDNNNDDNNNDDNNNDDNNNDDNNFSPNIDEQIFHENDTTFKNPPKNFFTKIFLDGIIFKNTKHSNKLKNNNSSSYDINDNRKTDNIPVSIFNVCSHSNAYFQHSEAYACNNRTTSTATTSTATTSSSTTSTTVTTTSATTLNPIKNFPKNVDSVTKSSHEVSTQNANSVESPSSSSSSSLIWTTKSSADAMGLC
ncbi:hypothetical protein HELRODRAFT_166120 [Helobdella robusta]|uniref:Uncharacterized protein n=1 Tax=Helobdella robusta TaxID=6412 RepID=T1EXT2_HELRO|nr:hypothetical protein HELRODRAFT_166120 [Helobdella robusta]ESN90454.1 hypothetical protein HELRODRAFT_166120 [Helobdella robusta]